MSYSSEVLADSPLLYLQLDETSGASCANTGSLGGTATCNGTYTRNVSSAYAGIGKAVTLDGAGDDDYISYPDNSALRIDGDVTYEAWIKATSFPGALCYVMGKGTQTGPLRSYGLYVRDSGYIAAQAVGAGGGSNIVISATGVISTGTWYHVVFTGTSGNFVIYVNGSSVATASASPSISNAVTLPFDIGRLTSSGGGQWGWAGQIDEVAVYNHGLSSTRVAAHYAAATAVSAPVANFTGTPTSGTASLSVAFTDSSTNTPTSWAWTFGDGGTSTSQNPSHSYTTSGIYTVTLVATNAAGADTKTRTGYITVGETISYASGGGITIW